MSQYFFKDLAYIEKVILKDNKHDVGFKSVPYSVETKNNLNELIKFIEAGNWSKSVHTKFIAKYFRVAQAKLPDVYYSVTGEVKQASTFRNQCQKVSKNMFDYFGQDFGQPFLDDDVKGQEVILNKAKVLGLGDVYFEDIFDLGVSSYINANSTGDLNYTLDDCSIEMEALFALSKTNIANILSSCDANKLGYIMSLFKEPLFEHGKVNDTKLKLLTNYAGVIQSRPPVEKKLDDANIASTANSSVTQLGDLVLPSAVVDVISDQLSGVKEKIPENNSADVEEFIVIVYLLYLYQVSAVSQLFGDTDLGILKYVLGKYNDKGYDGTDAITAKANTLFDGISGVLTKDMNTTIGRALSRYINRSSKVDDAFSKYCEQHGVSSYHKSVLYSYFKEGIPSYADKAKEICTKYAISTESVIKLFSDGGSPIDALLESAVDMVIRKEGKARGIELLKTCISKAST